MAEDPDLRTPEQIQTYADGLAQQAADWRKQAAAMLKEADRAEKMAGEQGKMAVQRTKQVERGEFNRDEIIAKSAPAPQPDKAPAKSGAKRASKK